jgi:ribosomal protein S27E
MKNCNSCGTQLTPVFGEAGTNQFLDAMNITLEGGWGMYFDAVNNDLFSSQAVSAILCKNCTTTLLLQNPWMEQLVKPGS